MSASTKLVWCVTYDTTYGLISLFRKDDTSFEIIRARKDNPNWTGSHPVSVWREFFRSNAGYTPKEVEIEVPISFPYLSLTLKELMGPHRED